MCARFDFANEERWKHVVNYAVQRFYYCCFFFNKIKETSATKLFPTTLPTTDPITQDNVGLNFVFPKNEKQ